MKFLARKTVLLVLLSLLLAACSAVAGSGQAKLSGITWKLASYQDAQGQVVNALPDVDTTMKFEGDSISGSAGCNSYSAKFNVNGENITFSQAISTLMACESPQGAMDQESAFLQALGKAVKFKLGAGQLDIYDSSNNLLMSFNAAGESQRLSP